MKKYQLLFTVAVFSCINNLKEATDSIEVEQSAEGISRIVVDQIFTSAVVKIDAIPEDSIKLATSTKRIALNDDQDGRIDLQFDMTPDSSGNAHLKARADQSDLWQFYNRIFFATTIQGPSRLGFDLYMDIGYPFQMVGFKGFHNIIAKCSSKGRDSICLETVLGCRIEAEVTTIFVKIFKDSIEFNGITIVNLSHESAKQLGASSTKHQPRRVTVMVPQNFKAWVKCTIKEKRAGLSQILINKDKITESVFEGSINGGEQGRRTIEIVAWDLIKIIPTVE